MTRRSFCGLAASALATGMVGCSTSGEGPLLETTLFAFDTVCVLGGVMAQALLDEAAALCQRYERLFSRTLPDSDVSRINRAGGAWVEVDTETSRLVEASLRYSEESGGLFDVTIGCVSELWDFTKGVVADDVAIRAALPHVGWERVSVRSGGVRLEDPLARIDLGGIAKGYIADALCGLFAERGVESAFVNLGGNVKVQGAKPDGSPWVIGVRDPFAEDASSVVAKIDSTGGSLVTSGLYERSFEAGGRRYWHILDPRTGYPVETDVASGSVYSVSSIDGDGYTKPLFMLGGSEALSFIEAHPNIQALLVDFEGELSMSAGAGFREA